MKVIYRGEQPKVKFRGKEFARGDTVEVPNSWKMPFDFDVSEMLKLLRTNKQADRFNDLSKIDGIGEKTIEDLRKMYDNDFDNLIRDCKRKKDIAVRDDIAKKLIKELGG